MTEGGGHWSVDTHTHVCVEKSSDTFPFITAAALSRTHPTGKLAKDFLSRLSLTRIDCVRQLIGPSGEIDFFAVDGQINSGRTDGNIHSNDDGHLNPSFRYWQLNKTVHTMFFVVFLFVCLIRLPAVYTISRNLKKKKNKKKKTFFYYFLHDRWVHHGRSLRSFEHPDVITDYTALRTRIPIFPRRFKRSNQSTERRQIWNFWKKNICAGQKKTKNPKDKKETVNIITWIIIRRFNVVWKEEEEKKRANALLTAKKIRPIKHKIVGPAKCLGFFYTSDDPIHVRSTRQNDTPINIFQNIKKIK